MVCFLNDIGRLKHVKHIISVSGGSVLAGHLLLNWDKYAKGSRKDFAETAQGLLDFIQEDMRGDILRHVFVSPVCWVLAALAAGVCALASLAFFGVYPWWVGVLAAAVAPVAAFPFALWWVFSRMGRASRFLQTRYEKLFNRAKVGKLAATECPAFYILATSLTASSEGKGVTSAETRQILTPLPPDAPDAGASGAGG